MLANIAPAASLLVIGSNLVGLNFKGLRTTVAIMGVGKLIVHPLAVLAGITLMGVTDPAIRTVALIMGASPMLSSLTVYSQRYGDEGPCSAAVLATTIASFLTLSGWLWLISHSIVR